MKRSFIFLIIPFLFGACESHRDEDRETPVKRDFNSFVFVGMIGGRPGLYKYYADKNSFSELWQSRDEKVVELSYSAGRTSAFFLTAVKEGKEGIFPFIKDTRLYVIPDSYSEPQFVEEIGSGLQVFSRWESETVFRIVINTWDKKVSSYVNQKTIIFNTFGRILQEVNKTYDITTDGYPRLPKIKPDSLSPSGKFQVYLKEGKTDSVFLMLRNRKMHYYISIVHAPLNEISWSDDRNFLFFSTLDLTPADRSIFSDKPITSSLYAYSVSDRRLIKEWTGSGYMNFFTIGDFLIFDDGFGRNSSIFIYDFKEDKVIKRIKIKGGCGLSGIPEMPEFGA